MIDWPAGNRIERIWEIESIAWTFNCPYCNAKGLGFVCGDDDLGFRSAALNGGTEIEDFDRPPGSIAWRCQCGAVLALVILDDGGGTGPHIRVWGPGEIA